MAHTCAEFQSSKKNLGWRTAVETETALQ